MNIVAIVPSRYASSRFPGKPLAMIGGKSMVQRVYERVSKVKSIQQTIVATDDKRIFDHVNSFGGNVQMTGDHHESGTDRCAEVATSLKDVDLIINVQGDEPFLNPGQIELLIEQLKGLKNSGIATLAKSIHSESELQNPSVVKVVLNRKNKALYFSRSIIPHLRGKAVKTHLDQQLFYKHIGIYGFYRTTLLELARLEMTKLEKAESLEQLRWLENGYEIQVGITEEETMGIDTVEDLERAELYLKGIGE